MRFNSVGFKTFILASLPLLVIIFFTSNLILEKYSVATQMNMLEPLTNLSIKIGGYIHETQKERGTTTGFLGSNDIRFIELLGSQRQETDRKKALLETYLASLDYHNYNSKFIRMLNLATEEMKKLEQIRARVDNHSISVPEAIDYYTRHNSLFLDTVGLTAEESTHSEIGLLRSAYANFMKGKERAGIERAVMTSTFAADSFSKEGFLAFITLMVEQKTYFTIFYANATHDQKELFDRTMASDIVEEVQRMRDIAYEKGRSLEKPRLMILNSGIDPQHWFNSISKKINQLKKIEDRIALDLGNIGSSLKATAVKQLYFAAVMALIVCSLVLTLVFFIIKDITARIGREKLKELNVKLERLVAARTIELENTNRELKEFAYIVSHDLKAPLRAISQLTSWISEDYAHAFDDKGKEQMELVLQRTRRMDRLINGILQYSRVGRIAEADKALDLNTFVKEVTDSIAPPDHIKVIIDTELPTIHKDPVRMEQIFQNLIGNAMKFMDKAEGIITVGCIDEGAHYRFSIQDNGPGFDIKYQDKIFQIFQTLNSRDEYESTGIGLALVKKNIELYGGSIWVESEPAMGSTFFFTLPKKGENHEKI
jgi:signal transduction histidine kinase